MKFAKGPRPWSINLFAGVLLILAIWNLAVALFDLPAQEEFLRSLGLGLDWNRDWTIVSSSAWFTVELIPIALVWIAASRFARMFITGMAGVKAVLLVANFPVLYALPGILAGQCIALAAVALLYTRGSQEWFAIKEIDPATFD
ncbi:hypothetical protein FGU71_05175 [Erythrobacter insulae]|uniref:Uncharacterized protein n=1 Tax=Erythrobacter insulae TaxID=2584124 RepID=A0A547PAZ8_9SPHN|nr:hypothetical protein [Erythrobacter insulae]TRD11297.1 hypothetical protein FGU71_05175 [Erythrobacter insulae]